MNDPMERWYDRNIWLELVFKTSDLGSRALAGFSQVNPVFPHIFGYLMTPLHLSIVKG